FPFALINACFFTSKYEIQIIDDLPNNSPQLEIHCASRDNDLEHHFLNPNQDFTWSFCMQVFRKTLFFCHFWWGSKNQIFDVFNNQHHCVDMGTVPIGTKKCVWIVKSDGIYLGFYQKDGYIHKNHYSDWN
ncbi:putative proline-rich receptor-like protein kinase PERK4-like, partial [Capsicum annuum]